MADLTLHTPLCDLLDIKYPIVLAGMGGAAVPELVAAVSNAGGLGILGAASLEPDKLAEWISRTRDLTSEPFGVDTLLPMTVPQQGEGEHMRQNIRTFRRPMRNLPRPFGSDIICHHQTPDHQCSHATLRSVRSRSYWI
jgi:NAD(P)H-dependent flavin oxidoreductase YrpB (nitropropane dioxygenase family)